MIMKHMKKQVKFYEVYNRTLIPILLNTTLY